jgi:hypothetical protein
MSCQNELTAQTTKIFEKILLCTSCQALAEKSKMEIVQTIEKAKDQAMVWLTDHILKGGLLKGGSGIDGAEVGGLPFRVQAQVPKLRGAEGPEATGVPLADRKRSSD